jgi:hypothetical protein
MSLIPNDNVGVASLPTHGEPDAHGQAALLLAESILHALVEKAMLTGAEALAVVQTAMEIKLEVATIAGESTGRMEESLALLSTIAMSFQTDVR